MLHMLGFHISDGQVKHPGEDTEQHKQHDVTIVMDDVAIRRFFRLPATGEYHYV